MIANIVKKIFAVTCAITIIFSLNFCEASKKIVAVMPLENVSGYDEEKVAEIMTEQLIVALHSSGVYTVVERAQMGTIIKEQGFQNIAVDPAQAVKLGKIIGADYSMVGKVTMAVVETNPTASTISKLSELFNIGNLGSMAEPFVNKFKGKIQLEFRLVDNATGEVVIAKTIEGSKSGSNVTTAFNNACKNAADNFVKELDTINPFRARVADISGADIYIDHGSESGLKPGDTLAVVREGDPIIVNGKTVGMKNQEIGNVKVIEVFSDYAICHAEGNITVHKGDVVKRQLGIRN